VFVGSERFPELNEQLDRVAADHGVSSTTVALAWLLRHPARMQPVIGTMKVDRLRECCRASEVQLSREEWYAIYLAAGKTLP
jgi:predicted oxidoreductase